MSNRDDYFLLCQETCGMPIYAKPFWLDAVCGKENWNVYVHRDTKGKIDATIPYYIKKKGLVNVITNPCLTQNNGSVICYGSEQSTNKKLEFLIDVIEEFIKEIESEKISYYVQSFPNTLKNWTVFYWHGFSQRTAYSYIINNSSYEAINQKYTKSLRQTIRTSGKKSRVIESEDIEKHLEIVRETYKKKNLKFPYDEQVCKKVFFACKEHDCCKLYIAINADDIQYASGFFVEDERSVYYLMGGCLNKFENYNGETIIIDKAIQYAATKDKIFDFEGSMNRGIETFMRKYGGTPEPYYIISKPLFKSRVANWIFR